MSKKELANFQKKSGYDVNLPDNVKKSMKSENDKIKKVLAGLEKFRNSLGKYKDRNYFMSKEQENDKNTVENKYASLTKSEEDKELFHNPKTLKKYGFGLNDITKEKELDLFKIISNRYKVRFQF